MQLITNRPYSVIWGAIPILILVTLLGFNHMIDIQMHEAYFVIAIPYIGAFFSLGLAIIGLLYWWARKKQLIDWMTIGHVSSTLFILAFILIVGWASGGDLRIKRMNLFVYLLLIGLLSQLIFVLRPCLNFNNWSANAPFLLTLRCRTGLDSLGYHPEPAPCFNKKVIIFDVKTEI